MFLPPEASDAFYERIINEGGDIAGNKFYVADNHGRVDLSFGE